MGLVGKRCGRGTCVRNGRIRGQRRDRSEVCVLNLTAYPAARQAAAPKIIAVLLHRGAEKGLGWGGVV